MRTSCFNPFKPPRLLGRLTRLLHDVIDKSVKVERLLRDSGNVRKLLQLLRCSCCSCCCLEKLSGGRETMLVKLLKSRLLAHFAVTAIATIS